MKVLLRQALEPRLRDRAYALFDLVAQNVLIMIVQAADRDCLQLHLQLPRFCFVFNYTIPLALSCSYVVDPNLVGRYFYAVKLFLQPVEGNDVFDPNLVGEAMKIGIEKSKQL